MNLEDLVLPAYAQMLSSLRGQLDKAAAHAKAKGFDFAELLAARLAPDMYPLSAQIRFVCVQATEAWSRLTGQGPLDTPEVDALSSAHALIDATIERLRNQRSEGAAPEENTMVVLDLRPELVLEMTLAEYVRSWSTPQFYFHLNTAYAIMRHNGVDLGKADYVPHVLAFVRK